MLQRNTGGTTMTEPLAAPPPARGPAGIPLRWLFAIVLAFLVPFGLLQLRKAPEPLPVLAELPDFRLTDQDGAPFSRARLQGHVTVASFLFTSCPTVCPLLTEKLARLQERTSGSGLRLVSFSVDPDTDTPPVLKAYGAAHKADFARWTFLTGPRDDVDRAVVDGFRIAVIREKRDAGEGADIWDIVHGEHFVLLDAQARIRGYYRTDEEGLGKLEHDAAGLMAEAVAEPLAGTH